MIMLYVGTPGSGKSLHAAMSVRSDLKFNRNVIGTFHINKKALFKNSKYEYTYKNIYELEPKYLIDYAKKHLNKYKNPEGQFLLVIDECQRLFNPRDWGNKTRLQWISFFTEHRHLGYDVILICQNERLLDRQIRELIEYVYIHRKVSQFGIAGKILGLIMGQFVCVKMWRPLKQKIHADFFRGDKKLYSFYDSFEDFTLTDSGVGGSPDEGNVESPETIDKTMIEFLPHVQKNLVLYGFYGGCLT